MEVKIGVQQAPRELSLESNQSPGDVEAAVLDAISHPQGILSLVDERGRRLIIPGSKLAYVEIVDVTPRSVGFTVA